MNEINQQLTDHTFLLAAPQLAAASNNTHPGLLKRVVNIATRLFAAPIPDQAQAWRQACELSFTRCQTAAEFVQSLRQRLGDASASHLMQPDAQHPAYWLPAIIEPALSSEQLRQLASYALNLPQLNLAWIERNRPALYNLLVDEISQAAANRQTDIIAMLLPQLLRLPAVLNSLSRLHPLLPVALWATQLLWQIQQQGVLNALGSELKMQLHHWLMRLDGAQPAADSLRSALSDKQLWGMVNTWLEKHLSLTGDTAESIAPQPEPAAALAVVAAHQWQVNSAINMAAQQNHALQLQIESCYELLKLQTRPVDIVVSCAPQPGNSSLNTSTGQGAQLTRSLVLGERGEMYTRLQLDSGEAPMLLQGVTIPAQTRPQALQLLAGPDDRITLLPVSAAAPGDDQLAALVIKGGQQQLTQSGFVTRKLQAVSNILQPAASGWGYQLSSTLSAVASWLLTPGKADRPSAWPLPGLSAAEFTTATTTLQLAEAANASRGETSVDDLMESLCFKYPDQLERYPDVVISQVRQRATREVLDSEVPLAQALQLLDEAELNNPQLLLNFHPGWSKHLADDIHHHLSGKVWPAYNDTAPMAWDEPQNQWAAWQLGVGLGRLSLENMGAITRQIRLPIWDAQNWIRHKISTIVTLYGADPNLLKADTKVKIYLRMPSVLNRQHMPVNATYDGTLQPLLNEDGGDWTLQDIFTDAYKRGPVRPESMLIEFPASVNDALKKEILDINLQAMFMQELQQAFADNNIRKGMLSLYETLFNHALERVWQQHRANNIPFTAASLRDAIKKGEFYQLSWFGHRLHNLVFIAVEKNESDNGIILSLWDDRIFTVKIDRLSAISFYEKKKAHELLALLEKSLPIDGREKAHNKSGIYDDSIIINTSGRYQVQFHGKAFIRKTWLKASEDQCVLQLLKTPWVEKDLLLNLAAGLNKDMNFLVLTDTEHRINTLIETFDTIGMLISFFSVPVAITSASGGVGTASKMLAQISSWRSSAILNTACTIFPRLVQWRIADRRQEQHKALMQALLSIAAEGVSYLLNQHGARMIIGMIHQGKKAVSIPYHQLPGSFTLKIEDYAKRFFAAYKNILMRTMDFSEMTPALGDAYELPYIDSKAPAPVELIKDEIEKFPDYIRLQIKEKKDLVSLFSHRDNILEHLRVFFTSRGRRTEIGTLLSWDNYLDPKPSAHNFIRIISADPEIGSVYSETENICLDSHATPDRIEHVITDEDTWLNSLHRAPRYQNKAVGVKWFDDMTQAQNWYQAFIGGRGGSIKMLKRYLKVRPGWYHRAITADVLKNLDRRQSNVLQDIYAMQTDESLEDVKILNLDSLSLNLSYLYTTSSIAGVDLLAEEFDLLVRRNISKVATPFPDRNLRVVATELMGVSSDNNGNVTITNYAAPRDVLLNNQLQSWSPDNITAAVRHSVSSILYNPAIDQQLLRQKRHGNNTLMQKRIERLEKNTRWLNQSSAGARVPMLLGIDLRKLGATSTVSDNLLPATFPADAIAMVISPASQNETLAEIIQSIRDRPLPVTPLLIQDKPEWRKTVDLAYQYALFPAQANARLSLSNETEKFWLPVIELQLTHELINFAAAQQLREETRSDNYGYFIGEGALRIEDAAQLKRIQPGARLILLDQTAGPGKPPMSHALMQLEDGQAIGANNQLIGGGKGWEIVWLETANWVRDVTYGFVLAYDDHLYSLHIQTSSQIPPVKPVVTPELHKDAVKVITLAEQYISQPGAMMGINASWEEVLMLYLQAGMLNRENFNRLQKETREDHFALYLAIGSQLVRSKQELLNAPPGSRLIFMEKPEAADDKPLMRHSMVVTSWGTAIGVRNQPIGGGEAWQKIALNTLNVLRDTRHGLVITQGENKLLCVIAPPLTDGLFS
ncbi:hypothetical protein N5923_18430 [Erwiniaceae bacterium BAC15a-03b]|uniref:Uncharacterized protein n=1 Tax=Winslowiella arboricola TaxID=2978220 RepID=A0A9J6PZN4_9GAMM|nr:hypothetical protein [Winslowiella arboricola]MCU5775686.1 hypothetical protein [Winslowiella arboricola]MCU5779463.1 hypothetical protein [Winslowiella arboricola]